jgi:hypothetical protein
MVCAERAVALTKPKNTADCVTPPPVVETNGCSPEPEAVVSMDCHAIVPNCGPFGRTADPVPNDGCVVADAALK